MSAGPGPDPPSRPISEEAMRILEPSQKKLPSLEAERTAGVMADCLHQVELLAMLPSVLQNLDRLSPSLSEELGEALSGHRLTVERVDQAEEAPTAELDKEFRSSLKNVLRLLRDRPADLRAVRAAAEAGGPGRSEGMQGLIGGLQGLHRILVQRLLTGPGEERQRARFLQDLAQRHANNLGLLALLEEKVAAVTRERDAENNF
ncbi:dynein regulatory complex protein 10 [Gadus chalcogrammus]|uniref:dynein regulatory complex protein 10 n=1 Tax=Gadus chalcogrammus TaxID=1042646 RepID=UPI0024C4BF3C|nr:dynein regulatory complex protein 10 [Gadus chalcogrammus]